MLIQIFDSYSFISFNPNKVEIYSNIEVMAFRGHPYICVVKQFKIQTLTLVKQFTYHMTQIK